MVKIWSHFETSLKTGWIFSVLYTLTFSFILLQDTLCAFYWGSSFSNNMQILNKETNWNLSKTWVFWHWFEFENRFLSRTLRLLLVYHQWWTVSSSANQKAGFVIDHYSGLIYTRTERTTARSINVITIHCHGTRKNALKLLQSCNKSVFQADIRMCSHCLLPYYFTTSLLYYLTAYYIITL